MVMLNSKRKGIIKNNYRHVNLTKEFIRDTSDLLQKIECLEIPDNCIIASFDVVSLYTSIQHDGGVESVTRSLMPAFLGYLNSRLSDISFTLTHSSQSVSFLDVLVTVENGHLTTDLFTKDTDRNTILRQRGYPHELLERQRRRVTIGRDGQGPIRTQSRRIAFVSTYNDLSPMIAKVLRKHWHLLSGYENVPEFVLPPLMSYRRTTNLRDKLVVADISKKTGGTQKYISVDRKGCFPCRVCVNCKYLVKGEKFQHPITHLEYPISVLMWRLPRSPDSTVEDMYL
ncbi:uncharacterized protein LOC130367391 [Hyla sarda]|uniref:uncharacterized protein LOC130367391 n=1 Tax=Hyla sarda TaxID=327740 RepID=UPI0024C31781|nr:uncharacterized protein LOC130367391 [Hyla sarda]